MKTRLLASLLLILCSTALSAQVKKSPETATVTLPTAVSPGIPSLSLALQSDEAIRTFDVPLQSNEDKSIQVFGVQTTRGLYVVDYPKSISAKGKSTLTLIYVAEPNSSSDTDTVRLLTDHGEKVIELKHDRAQVASLDRTNLEWQQNDALTPKTIIVTVAPNSVVPKSVKALGNGGDVTLQSLGGNRYQITVTPASTAKVRQFPVTIRFAPSLPGLPTTIVCSIVPKA